MRALSPHLKENFHPLFLLNICPGGRGRFDITDGASFRVATINNIILDWCEYDGARWVQICFGGGAKCT